MIRVITISGDQQIIEKINKFSETYCSDIDISASTHDLKTGISIINEHQPDLVIIDTFLNDGSGFELLNHFTHPDFKIIFISEYSEYAIKSIDYNPVGFLLRPINDQKFIASIQRARDMISREEKLQLSLLGNNLQNLQKNENIMLRTSEQIHLVNYNDLIRVEADGNYSTFYINDGRKVLVSKTLKEFEEKLLENGFFRIHKSHMINIQKLRYFDKADGGFVIMIDESRIPVASRKRDAVIELLDTLS